MSNWTLGELVTFDGVLRRVERSAENWRDRRKTWEVEDCRFTEGILVGLRTLQNGVAEYLGDDEGWAWKQTGAVCCAVVAVHLRRKHVFVPIDRLMRRTVR